MSVAHQIRTLFLIIFLMSAAFHSAHGQMTSFRSLHPLATMHFLPVGETPGWNQSRWFQFDFSQSNVWNPAVNLQNLSNGRRLTYGADYEQTTLNGEIGWALGESWAVGAEIQSGFRWGGFLDSVIDRYHILIRTDRFSRPDFPTNKSSLDLASEGSDRVGGSSAPSLANMKLKVKYWFWKWKGGTTGACDCGMSTSLQLHVPIAGSRSGWSSGSFDTSWLLHFGVPINNQSGVWMTMALSHLPRNNALEGWPRRSWLQMYEVASDWGVSDNWGITLKIRAESPFMNQKQLLVDETLDIQTQKRISSAWNALTEWRGSQELGLRYRWDDGDLMSVSFVEDWGLTAVDGRAGALYVNNAPDIVILTQGKFHF